MFLTTNVLGTSITVTSGHQPPPPPSKNSPLPIGNWNWTPSNTTFLGVTSFTTRPHTADRSLCMFLHSNVTNSPLVTMGRPYPPKNYPLPCRDPHPNPQYIFLHQSDPYPKRHIQIQLAVFPQTTGQSRRITTGA